MGEHGPLTYLAVLAAGLVLWWVGVLLLYALGPARRTWWRRRRTVAAAARRHPGAVLVPGYAGAGMYATADRRGVLPRSWRRAWESDRPMVLAVLPDRVEVWVPGVGEPLWSVRRVENGARVRHMTVQEYYGTNRGRDELWFSDAEASAGIFPEYVVRLVNVRNHPAEDLARALRETGTVTS